MFDRIVRHYHDRPGSRIVWSLGGVVDMDHFGALLATLVSLSVLVVLTIRGYPIYSRSVRPKSHVRLGLFLA